jgi:NAD(P)-dependent dehydrogenase (short-subunit alcohol dehydrogenase family)
MIETGGGSIVHISSTNALLGCPGLAVYSTVKSGFFGFSRAIATEFGGRGIRSNVICPGLMGDGRPDTRQPLGRTCVAEDIANATLFLASDEASFITGQVLAVDGGHTTSYPEIF